jgi:hypothetical protein
VLTKGYVTFVDPEDAAILAAANWYARKSSERNLIYTTRYGESGNIHLHRVILGEPGSEIDHTNHNALDNRRGNLRPCSSSQNNGNSRRRLRRSGFRGVYLHRKRWRALITCDGKTRHLGTFDTPEEAARAYDAAAVEHFAKLNFPPPVRTTGAER